MVEHPVLSLVILDASVFEMSCGKTDRQTYEQSNTRTPLKPLPTPPAVGVSN